MNLVEPKLETNNDGERAYEVAKEVLRKHPDLKGFQGSSSLDVIGIGRAVEEAGMQGKICVYGTGLPTEAGKFLESGAINGIAFWDPKLAGIAMNKVAQDAGGRQDGRERRRPRHSGLHEGHGREGTGQGHHRARHRAG